MALTPEIVKQVSLLARLQLSADELELMTQQLGRVLEYIDKLAEVDTENVAPLAHAVELSNVFADDQVAPSLPREEVLANAPKRDDACYRVPAVLGD